MLEDLEPRWAALLTWLAPGLLGALVLTVWGAGRGWILRLVTLSTGVLVLWGCLLGGVGAYFSAWQETPGAPEEAFADGGPLVFVLFAGWLPSGVLLLGVRVLLTLARWVLPGRRGR
ncbi:MAG: hypothetical protein O2799_04245 [Planctomycetota bacterium]|nr:hypothetical protein [Planctomycetota bacterium]